MHLQAITMITLLQLLPDGSACVRTFGGAKEHCSSIPFSNYDPYEGRMEKINFPTMLVEENGRSLAPDISQQDFVMWGYNFDTAPEGVGYYGGRFNSGEDVQSFASVTWYPFISKLFWKTEALRQFSGGMYIANMLAEKLIPPSGLDNTTLAQMMNVSLLSVFTSRQNLVSSKDYLMAYPEITGETFGSRSTATLRELRNLGIRSYFSACLTLTINMEGASLTIPNSTAIQCGSSQFTCHNIDKPPTNGFRRSPLSQRDMILAIDLQDRNALPKSVQDRATWLPADIPARWPYDFSHGFLPRMQYAYRLLSLYASQAKVVITSRIHVGLPATALGIPVIFIENGNWLPGGAQRSGRVEGLLEIFHRVNIPNGQDWSFGDLTGSVPLPKGVHLADRYRGSFLNRLSRQSSYYADAARLFGMIPFQRLGRQLVDKDEQDIFHFILDSTTLSVPWHVRRSMEHVFFFHPNAKVYAHVITVGKTSILPIKVLGVIQDSGYDLVVETVSSDGALNNAAQTIASESNFDKGDLLSNPSLLPYLVVWQYGGVYLSHRTNIHQTILQSSMLDGTMAMDTDGRPALLALQAKSSKVVPLMRAQVEGVPSTILQESGKILAL